MSQYWLINGANVAHQSKILIQEEIVERVGESQGMWEVTVLWGQLFCTLKTALKIKSITSWSSSHVNACSFFFFLFLSFAFSLLCLAIKCPGHDLLLRACDRKIPLLTPSFHWGPLSGTQCPAPAQNSLYWTSPLIPRDFSQIPSCCSRLRGEELYSLGRRTQVSREF